ncbi:hypothetical protein A0256_00765 [Mucilaginibacter sp. PAMC 26640]|nr:hypothetical protein A0256_00765 [Mucilaginibacter sp. PAMC 26640]
MDALFIRYGHLDAEGNTEMRPKVGIVIQKHSFGDLITFNWSNAPFFIEVNNDLKLNMSVTA